MSVSTDVVISGMANANPSTGVISDALPETTASSTIMKQSSKTGVSTKNTLFAKEPNDDLLTINEQKEPNPLTPHPSPLTVKEPPLTSQNDCPPESGVTSPKGGGGMSSLIANRSSKTPFLQERSEEATPLTAHRSPLTVKNWYVLRTTYSREQQAYAYITTHGGTAYLPTLKIHKEVDGKHVTQLQSRIPNILFAHGTLKEVQHFVYDNKNLPYLRFYYSQERFDGKLVRRPLIVPERQMESLRILCAIDDGNITLVPQNDTHFHKGQEVRITQGRFAGVTGRVARYQGQQRVAVIIEGLITIATAYIPTAFLTPIGND